MTELPDALLRLLAPEVVAALDEHVRALVADAVRAELGRRPTRRWLTLAEAAKEYGCSAEAMRMRAARGTVDSRKQGRRLYVRADENGKEAS